MNKPKLAGLTALLAGAAGGFLYYGRKVEPDAVVVNRLWLRLPRLIPAFEGYRLVQISDIHAGPIWGRSVKPHRRPGECRAPGHDRYYGRLRDRSRNL